MSPPLTWVISAFSMGNLCGGGFFFSLVNSGYIRLLPVYLKSGKNKRHGFCFMWERQKRTSKQLKDH